MIKNIEISNFKSIRHAKIDLSSFTVLVGANESGKSNLMKGLTFLAAILRHGLTTTINRFGGFEGLLPRTLSADEAQEAKIAFSHQALYSVFLHDYDENWPDPVVEHKLEIGLDAAHAKKAAKSEHAGFRVTNEKLLFHQPLAVAESSRPGPNEVDSVPVPSYFTLERGPRGVVRYVADPPLEQAPQLYWEWLGLLFLERQIGSAARIKKTLQDMAFLHYKHSALLSEQETQSFLGPDVETVVRSASQNSLFTEQLKHVRKYDLQPNQLRAPQPLVRARQLAADGSNMPSVVRYLRTHTKTQASWNRILKTFGAIAPHIKSISTNSLPTGQEYVVFLEKDTNQALESWQASDGTLRALAILLALETHPIYSTVLIEEPELNLHPWAIKSVIEHIREVISKRYIQVIVTTHSAQVVQNATPEEVVVVSRTAQGESKFEPLRQRIPTKRFTISELSRMWERGLLHM